MKGILNYSPRSGLPEKKEIRYPSLSIPYSPSIALSIISSVVKSVKSTAA